MSPLLMEALQMLKSHLKKERLSFMASWKTLEKDMICDAPDDNLLTRLLDDGAQDDLDFIINLLNKEDN